jgi:hypothetical protein
MLDPIVMANPQWWMLEVFNGFGPDISSLIAMQYHVDSEIVSMKAEGDSLHCNQAHNKYIAKNEKPHIPQSLRTNLSLSRTLDRSHDR